MTFKVFWITPAKCLRGSEIAFCRLLSSFAWWKLFKVISDNKWLSRMSLSYEAGINFYDFPPSKILSPFDLNMLMFV
jgi:hypothetical protein